MQASRPVLSLLSLMAILLASVRASAGVAPGQFRWAGDPEGGAPYVEASPQNPDTLVGFDVEVAELLARGLGLEPRFVFVTFTSIDEAVSRGDAEIGLSGIEDTVARRRSMSVTVPYYEFREVLSVRDADAGRYKRLANLAGRRVGTLGNTLAYDILLAAEREHRLTAVVYEDDVHPFSDLLLGRVDAVLLDNLLADRQRRKLVGFTVQPESVAIGRYVGLLSKANAPLRDQVNDILRGAMRDGSLERVFRKWEVWNDDQPRLYRRVLNGDAIATVDGLTGVSGPIAENPATTGNWWSATVSYLPLLLRSSIVTIALSCLSMGLAVVVGVLIASGRVYGGTWLRTVLTVYVELMRGTPVLLQLFVLYYGIAAAVRLPAFIAAFLGLALNYAAYESEIYRSALEGVSVGQLEAARTLGFSERQVLSLIRGPQAFRVALAPMTNDFVALLKDSSLVSVLTVMELTKQTQIFATNLGSWVVPGLLCAALYLAMSLPLSALARSLEQRWKAPTETA